jgi:hypothetical protein
MLPSMNIKSKAENKSKIYQAHGSKRKWLFPFDDRRFGVLLFKGEEIRKGGGGVDREAVREVFLPRREDCLE